MSNFLSAVIMCGAHIYSNKRDPTDCGYDEGHPKRHERTAKAERSKLSLAMAYEILILIYQIARCAWLSWEPQIRRTNDYYNIIFSSSRSCRYKNKHVIRHIFMALDSPPCRSSSLLLRHRFLGGSITNLSLSLSVALNSNHKLSG